MCIDLKQLQLQFEKAQVFADHSVDIEIPPIYREDRTDKLFVKVPDGDFVCTNWSNLNSTLEMCGVELPDDGEERYEEVKRYRKAIIQQNTVLLATSIAGCSAGVLKTPDGMRLLITRSSTTVEPQAGDCSTFMAFIEGLLGENSTQLTTFLVYLKLWLEDYRKSLEVGPWAANLRQRQALIMVGQRNSGKSLLFELLRPLFGNRVVNPYTYFAGDTNFNGDHAAASMLLMDDSAESLLPGARQKLTQQVKQHVAVSDNRIHPKGMQAFEIRCCQRIFILGNEDQMEVLPFVPESFKDKVHVMSARPSELVRKTLSRDDAQAWVDKMKSELGAFAYHLLHEVTIPAILQDRRFGVVAYHDPELLAKLEGTEDMLSFMQMLEYALAAQADNEMLGRVECIPRSALQRGALCHPDPTFEYVYEGPAREVFLLMSQKVSSTAFGSLVRHSVQMGKLLEGASHLYPDKVSRGKVNRGDRHWKVQFALSKKEFESHAQLFRRSY